MHHLRDQRGLTLIEILIATVIVGIAGVGMAVMFSQGQMFITQEGDNRVAIGLAQQQIEMMRNMGGQLSPADPCAIGAPVGCSDYPVMTAGAVSKTYTRSWLVRCLNLSDYSAGTEGCAPAQYPHLPKLITVCVVEGSFSRACSFSEGGSTRTNAYPPSVVASGNHVVVLYSVMAPRF